MQKRAQLRLAVGWSLSMAGLLRGLNTGAPEDDALRRGKSGSPLDRAADVLKSASLPTMLTLRGSPALSSFRLQKLLQDLKSDGLPVCDANATFLHLVELTPGSGLTADENAVLEKLLTYGPRRAPHEVIGLQQIVAPRPGTISPWSSKATDIAHICGLTKIKRIERAVTYTLALDNAALRKPLSVLSAADLNTL
ncbi:MAG: hypothetical protein ABIV50_12505, partial [Opitutus sp.]